ncbi:nitroreductase family deazaflavin-dependent oxidoreductase [Chloroflexota bacterium]
MSKTYQITGRVRFINRLMKTSIRWGIAPKQMHMLTVKGRKTGKLYSTPVSIIEQDGSRWLVAPYGEVGWVRNARAAQQVTLNRGGKSETLKIEAVGAEEAAPVLKTYIAKEAITRPYFDAGPDSPIDAFVAEASRHPVFRLT